MYQYPMIFGIQSGAYHIFDGLLNIVDSWVPVEVGVWMEYGKVGVSQNEIHWLANHVSWTIYQ